MLPLTLTDGAIEAPHWAQYDPAVWPLFESFELFLSAVWAHLRLPAPTKRQLAIARRLQFGPTGDAQVSREDIIRAFRGIGKSYVCAAFVLWRLMRNPRDEKILVISATGSKSKEFVAQVKSILNTMDLLAFLRPREDQRDMADKFDVAGSSISQSYSLKAVGITGQITGSRATLIVADDIEIEGNSKTEEARERLMRSTSEFEAIKLPGADVVYLGTPQTEESVYNRLVKERGYSCYCIPARFPTHDKLEGYTLQRDDGTVVQLLAPELLEEFERGWLTHGSPTDPERFDETELASRESKGRSFFALQYQLDTSLSDAERYPLRTTDLVVFALNPLKAPKVIQWGRHSDGNNVIRDIPNLGFTGDILLRPLFADTEWSDYEGSVLFVDPAGRGKDETAWAVVKVLNGMMFCLHVGSLKGDPAAAMTMIARDAKRFSVNMVEVEPNFGQGMWVTAFQPILAREWPGGCSVQESEWAKGQKETRIIDTLEPVLTQHRLVIDESLLRTDVREQDRNYSLLHQLTHITRDRGSLQHDDRLDALAGAVAHFARLMAVDAAQAAKDADEARRQELIDQYFADLDDGATPLVRRRGRLRAHGSRDDVYTWTPGTGLVHWPGDE
jgi:hypothetical protein